jgi:nitrite reductase (NADH) large subunit
MFYVKTAGRLQRTSVWLEQLEGGLDYLKSVVIDDTLGIHAALESQMAHVIATYQCEWKTSLSDTQFLARFSEFINPEAASEPAYPSYQRLREQRLPQTILHASAQSPVHDPSYVRDSQIAITLIDEELIV